MASLRSLTVATSALALLSVALVDGAAIETNPTSLVEDVVPLTHFHPAYGAAVADEVAAYEVREFKDEAPVVVVGANLTAADVANAHGRSRMLESSNRDLQKLEDHFKTKMETNLQALSEFKKATRDTPPWPSSYWPIYQDGINAQWDPAHKSPAEKYASGFGLNVADFMDKVSKTNGVLSQKTRRKCKETTDCDSLKDGSICGRRAGEAQGFCIPGWFGICHAWAPAAILEDEPKCAVARGNVTFQPMDIKALITQVYDGAAIQTVFTGARFNGPNDPAKMDEFGRYTDAARRDLGPGFFHIAITNIMGKFKQSFVVDVTAGAEVWNQPVRNYEVVELKEMDVAAASQQFFKTDTYPFNPDAKKLAYVKTNFFWVVESLEDGPLVATGRVDASTESAAYEYLLELDGDDNIIGGEWLNDSRYNHPDFLWFPTGKPAASTVTSVGLKYSDVEQLLQDSLKCEQVVTPAPTTPEPTTPEPTTPEPTTAEPNTTAPVPTTPLPTTAEPNATTPLPTTAAPNATTPLPTTVAPNTTTPAPPTAEPNATTPVPTTAEPNTTTPAPTTAEPNATTPLPTTPVPTTVEPTATPLPSVMPTTAPEPTTVEPNTTTPAPSTSQPTTEPNATTPLPTTVVPTTAPEPSTVEPATTPLPTTAAPTTTPVPSPTEPMTITPATDVPSTTVPSTTAPATTVPTTDVPATTAPASTPLPTTQAPSTDDSDSSDDDEPPATVSPQTPAPTQPPATVMPTETPATLAPTPVTTTPAPTLPATNAPSTQCGKSNVGVDFYGADIQQVYWVSQAECCDACAQTDGCKAYTYVAQDTWGGASCYLKSGRGELRPNSGAISAELAPSSSNDNTDSSVQVLPAPESKCPTQTENLDFYGADLKAISASSAEHCCNACARHKRCTAFTLVGEVCYLKKGTGKPTFKLGAFSGVVAARGQGPQVQM